MLDRKHDQHQDRADPEGGIEVQRAKLRNGQGKRLKRADRGGQRGNTVGCSDRFDGISWRGASMGRKEINHRLCRGGVIRRMGGDPCQHRRRIRCRNREQRIEDVAGGNDAPQGQNRAPGKPVAPDRQGRDQLGVSQPGNCAIDRSAAGFGAEHPGHFGIGEALQKPHDHRNDPDEERHLARHAGNPADREQHQRRNPGRNPERTPPVQRAHQLVLASRSTRWSDA